MGSGSLLLLSVTSFSVAVEETHWSTGPKGLSASDTLPAYGGICVRLGSKEGTLAEVESGSVLPVLRRELEGPAGS